MSEIWLPPENPDPPKAAEPRVEKQVYRLTAGFDGWYEYVVVATATMEKYEWRPDPEPCYVTFTVYEAWRDEDFDLDAAAPETDWFSGHIKWDGCSNWDFNTMMHFCNLDQVANLSRVIRCLYEIAAQWMPSNDFDDELKPQE